MESFTNIPTLNTELTFDEVQEIQINTASLSITKKYLDNNKINYMLDFFFKKLLLWRNMK
jgi:hypothetical protein